MAALSHLNLPKRQESYQCYRTWLMKNPKVTTCNIKAKPKPVKNAIKNYHGPLFAQKMN